jgi:putative transposase
MDARTVSMARVLRQRLRPSVKGYGAFSYSRSQIDSVIKYIDNQEEHHRKATFKDEYLGLLEKFDVLYDERYLFEWYD